MSKGNRMRATFSQQGEEIKGTISLQGDGLFMLEYLGLLVKNLAAYLTGGPFGIVASMWVHRHFTRKR